MATSLPLAESTFLDQPGPNTNSTDVSGQQPCVHSIVLFAPSLLRALIRNTGVPSVSCRASASSGDAKPPLMRGRDGTC
jgi:hypothetical protein